MNYEVIIAAGGTGKRLGHEIPKQFISIHGKPIIIHTIEKFLKVLTNGRIIVAMHPDWISHFNELKSQWLPDIDVLIVDGGAERFHSVKNALTQVGDNGIISIHDAARPLIDEELIRHCAEAALIHDAVIPVIPVFESMRHLHAGGSTMVNRNEYVLIQTPQCFKSAILKKAYEQDYQSSFTDDASVVESMGIKIHMIPGSRKNIKITTNEDLQLATCWLTPR